MATGLAAQEERDYDLICPVCQDEYNDPVIIDCHHSFCRSCISAWIRHRPQSTVHFPCPSCKSLNKLPVSGTSGLPKSFYIEQLKNAKTRSQSLYPLCPKHKTEDLRFFCTTCEIPICRDCKVLKHEGHPGECVADIANDMRAKLMEISDEVERDLQTLNAVKYKSKKDDQTLAELKLSSRDMVKNQIQDIKRTLDNIALEVDNEICEHFFTYENETRKEKAIADSKSAELQNLKFTLNHEIKNGSDHDVIASYKELIEDRRAITVKDRKTRREYRAKLSNVYQKGTISESELKNMLGKVIMEKQIRKANQQIWW